MTEHIIRPTLIYIIRLWAEPDREVLFWRVTLQKVGSQLSAPPTPSAPSVVGFPSFIEATNFIQSEMDSLSDQYKEK